MKFSITNLLTVLLYTNCQCLSLFERSFEILHQEPPPPTFKGRTSVTTGWITQKLDQFNESDTRTWQMRYLANNQYSEAGGPIFILVGGEWEISSGWLTGGHVHDMAKEHNGTLFYTEHRYYGQSRPTSDLETENLKYLTVKQSLADLATFIGFVKTSTPGMEKSKVILTGGSYSGSMVTWFKRVYPDLIVGAWASSAPLFAKLNFIEYKMVAGQSIKLVGGESCYDRIQNGIAGLEKMLVTERAGELKAALKLCDEFDETNDLDVWTLFSFISDIFAGYVQNHRNGDIEKVCDKIMQGDDDVKGLSNFFVTKFGNSTCEDATYKSVTELLTRTNYSSSIYRQWIYQTCNEFGWYQTSGSTEQPFGTKFPLDLYLKTCQDAYGDTFMNETQHRNIDDTNKYFGGWTPQVENVFFSHGQLDPWHAMGITEIEKATVTPLHAHCKDLGSIQASDTPELKATKEKIAELVRIWLKDESETQL